MKHLLITLLAAMVLVSCGESKQDASQTSSEEQAGMTLLTRARQELAEGNTAAARETIEELRDSHKLAKQARLEAILTLDSIELLDARQAQDSLKQAFFERKLQEDLISLKDKLK